VSSSPEPLQTATGGGLPEGATWALNLLARPWTPHLLLLLAQRPTRYRDLHAALPAISTAVLTGRLRLLTDAGLVHRRLVDGDRGVHYEATTVGAALARPLANLAATAVTLRSGAP
jgi:DNA-binding HxlR family transcriptional regulator